MYTHSCFHEIRIGAMRKLNVYFLICVAGNLITGIIWLNHHNSSIDTYNNEANEKVDDFVDLSFIHLNETMLDATLEKEIREQEYSNVFSVLKNMTAGEVSITKFEIQF